MTFMEVKGQQMLNIVKNIARWSMATKLFQKITNDTFIEFKC